MEPEKAIANFLSTAYTDERLAALYAHVEDGRFSFVSCCCLRGAANADHALRGRMTSYKAVLEQHYQDSVFISGALDAERALRELLDDELTDERAQEIMLPLVRAEIGRRESLRSQIEAEVVMV